ncbi:hypothetical protein OG21DRAFT_1323981 [Imleria badia]|nr:hypothetical protein OG21DRAFT_1323981 [Imleria badia]
MFVTTIRALGWALARKLLVSQLRPVNNAPSTLMDALDLVSNLRGYGWDWSRGTRPSNRAGFILHTFLSAAAHAFVQGILHTVIRSFSPKSVGTLSSGPNLDETLPFLDKAIKICFPVGGSIFDESIPLYLRFLRLNVISALSAAWTYAGLQTWHDSCIMVGVLILGQDLT